MSASCPACTAPIATGARACRFCRAALRFDGATAAIEHPALKLGTLVDGRDLAHQPVPGGELKYATETYRHEATAAGAAYWVAQNRVCSSWFDGRMRDGFIRVWVVAIDPGCACGVVFRHEQMATFSTGYGFRIRPDTGKVRLSRESTGEGKVWNQAIVDWTASPAVRPLGAVNEVIVGAYGGSIQAWVNGVGVLAVHDPSLGIGLWGLSFDTDAGHPDGLRATAVKVEMWTVAS